MKAMMTVYTEKNGFDVSIYTNAKVAVEMERERLERDFRKIITVETIYQQSLTQPMFEVWEVKDSVEIYCYNYWSCIHKYGSVWELCFPHWPDLLHFMKEYLPILKDRD